MATSGGRSSAGSVAAAVGLTTSMVMPGFGAAVGAAAGFAVDKALSGPDVDLNVVKQKVERDPRLWRRDDETFREWICRLGLTGFDDDVHQLRRLELRAAYTDRLLKRLDVKDDLEELQTAYDRGLLFWR
jgi:hypothetical protein